MPTTLVSPPSELLTRQQAADYLGIKAQTLAVWATTHRHNLAFIKVGSVVRYRKSDLDAWLQSHVVGGIDATAAAE